MKKFLILVGAAALIGLLISGRRPTKEPTSKQSNPVLANASAEAAPATRVTLLKAESKKPSRPASTSELPSVRDTAKQAGNQPRPGAVSLVQAKPAPPEPAEQAEPEQSDLSSLRQAEALIKEGRRLEARKLLSALYRSAAPPERAAARKLLDQINKDLVFDPGCLEGATVHVIKAGEVLAMIAKHYGVNWRMIARVNAVDPKRIRENQKLKIITGKPEILVDKSDFRLALFIDGYFVKEYPIGHGKNGKTPTGTFIIDQLMIRPDWYPPEGGVIRYGEKGHLIGERWLGFKNRPGASGLGIHGTNDSQSIRTLCSNGCIRMLNEDVIELFDFVVQGAKVEILE